VLLFGRSRAPVVKQVGQRWFLSPGSFGEGGLLTLEDDDDGILLTLFGKDLTPARTERLSTQRAARLRVGGAGAG
jgi:hypothetical protein